MAPRPLRVLLMSPVRNTDPWNGDVVYTESLLERPPEGVTYVTYTDALRDGALVEHGRRSDVRAYSRFSFPGAIRAAREHVVNSARERGLLYREPFRFLEVRDEFDLIHCHTFSVRWSGRVPPIVISNAIPVSELYLRARGWSISRVRRADASDRLLSRALGVQHIVHGAPKADRVIAFTETLGRWYVERGVAADHLGVVPCFPSGALTVAQHPVPGRVGFIASDFDAKGGDLVVAAMRAVRAVRPDAHLLIVGSGSRLSEREAEEIGAIRHDRVAREEILETFLPSCAVFAYPSRFDGLPLTLLEAIGSGVPVVVSDYFALPEIVADGESGRVVAADDSDALACAILELLDANTQVSAGRATRRRYETAYAPGVVIPRLRENYDLAIGVLPAASATV